MLSIYEVRVSCAFPLDAGTKVALMSAMAVDLLINMLASNVGPASGGAEPISPNLFGPRQPDSSARIDRGEAITPDNSQIDGSNKPANAKPSRDFAETLEEKMQAEARQTADNAENTDAVAIENRPSTEQSASVPSEVSADLSAEVGKTVAKTANMPQQQASIEDSQLQTSSAIATPLEASAGQTEVAAMPTSVQSPKELTELMPEQGQIQSKGVQTSQGNVAKALDVQTTDFTRTDPAKAPNDDSAAQQNTPVEEKTGELLGKSLADAGKAQMAVQNAGNAVSRAVANTNSALKNNVNVGTEGSSDALGGSAKTGSNVLASALPDANADTEQQAKTLPQSSENSGKEVVDGEEAASAKSPVQKLNAAQIESVVSQSNARQTAAPEADKSAKLEQAIPVETPQISRSEQPLVPNAPNSAANTSASDNASAVSQQIRESITSSTIGPDQQITIRLNPPELGTVVVKFQEQDNQITGMLEVSKSQTRVQIQQLLPEIMRDLQDLGVQIKRIEVVMTAEPQSDALNGQSAMSQDDRWAGQQGPGGSEPDAPNASVGGLLAQDSAYMASTAFHQSYITDNSVDMFV